MQTKGHACRALFFDLIALTHSTQEYVNYATPKNSLKDGVVDKIAPSIIIFSSKATFVKL